MLVLPYQWSEMLTVMVFVGCILLVSLCAWQYGQIRYQRGHREGMSDGADMALAEAEPLFPWNASSELLYEWADIRAVEEAVSEEAEEFLKCR